MSPPPIEKNEIIYDCLNVLDDYIDSVVEEENEKGYVFDYTVEEEQYSYAVEMYMDTIIDREYQYGYRFRYLFLFVITRKICVAN